MAAQQYAAQFPGDIFFVVDAYSDPDQELQLVEGNTLLAGGKFLAKCGLTYFPKVGWQCGDFAYYAARSALPNYDYYWMIEPDVRITYNDDGGFFRLFEATTADYLGSNFGRRPPSWGWHKSVARSVNGNVYGATFPISRSSARLLDFLTLRRAEYCQEYKYNPSDPKEFANDEAFFASFAVFGGFKCESVAKRHPQIMTHCSSAVPILEEEVPHLPGKVLHPVCRGARAKQKFRRMLRSSPKKLAQRMEEVMARFGEELWIESSGLTIDEVNLAASGSGLHKRLG
ncbi:hypothetical protein RGQ15_13525 [Paracoccus sp. MBLB3053]|uniref:DUF5672 domain-containing protein n=1 Tax=Paracoccus aurantius TaxID=3073814 RepID=A0ABU2HU61_9RHOB|nr:hypothetical protein [Paracoccus sp. MBLB3053]MDS9468584.1 hypothetical protein [Paracoccus sp. MBLB3053]